MVGLNYGLFGALQGRLPVTPQTVLTLAGSHVLAAVAAAVGVGAFGGPAIGAVAVWTAWLAFAPWREGVAGDLRPALALALGAIGLALLVRRRAVPAGVALGLLGLLVPASLGAVGALALLGRWRAALAGVGTVVAGALLLALAAPGALPAPADLDGAARALAGTPQLQNAALGAFHARLFLGPETLAGDATPPLSLPAFALSLGALPGGGVARRPGGVERAGGRPLQAGGGGVPGDGGRSAPGRDDAPGAADAGDAGAAPLWGAPDLGRVGVRLRRDVRPRPGHRGGAGALRLAPSGVGAGAGAGPADPDAGPRRERPWPSPGASG